MVSDAYHRDPHFRFSQQEEEEGKVSSSKIIFLNYLMAQAENGFLLHFIDGSKCAERRKDLTITN